MSDPTPQSLSGLASILSSEPLPTVPMFRTMDATRIAAEVEQYVRNLHIYLRRLFGRFTATNIITTINKGGGTTGFDKIINLDYHYVGTNNLTGILIDDSKNWNDYAWYVIARLTQAGGTRDDILGTTGTFLNSGFIWPKNCSPPGVLVDLIGVIEVLINVDPTTGAITMDLVGSASHQDVFFQINLLGIAKVPASASFVFVGNGL